MARRALVGILSSAITLGLTGSGQAACAADSERPAITVLVHNQAAISADILNGAKEQVGRIFDDAGVGIRWMDPSIDREYSVVNPTANSLGTFTVQLIIRRAAAKPTVESASVMGSTIGDIHETGGSAFVFYDRVLHVAHAREQGVALVMGYAIAHELGHLLLPYPAHAERGIMRAAWDGDDLRHAVTGVVGFTPSQAALLRLKASGCCAVAQSGVTPYGLIASVSGLRGSAVAQEPTAGPQLTRAYDILLTGKARMVVKDAVEGAIRRLGRPKCQQLFTDFADPAGHALSNTLAAWGRTPGEALAALYFVEGDGSNQCRADETTAAFTSPGNRVIYVCGTRFADQFARKTKGGEILLIHELLHALGLGENPPTSARITDAVLMRCGN
jgi:hypothetical protein